MSFGEFRQIILQRTEDYKTKPLSKSYSAHEITSQDSIKTSVIRPQEESQLSEIHSMLKLQQKSLLSDQLDQQKSRSDIKPHSGQGKQFPRVKQPNLTCYRCGGWGHKATDCRSQVIVAYLCHHLSDNYVDLSDLYVDLSDIMSTCQIILLLSVWSMALIG